MDIIQEPKKIPKNYRIYLFILYQLALLFAIITAAISTYTAVKNGIVGKETDLFSKVYTAETLVPFTLSSYTIEAAGRDGCNANAATATAMWAFVIVLAALWYRSFRLLKTNNEKDIIKLNQPILIVLIVLCVIAAAVFIYDIISTTWIYNYHFPYANYERGWSYAKALDNKDQVKALGISFANIWNCTVAYAFFSGLVFVAFIPTIVFSAKTYNNWKISI